jgi:SecD/SecF fusion protein
LVLIAGYVWIRFQNIVFSLAAVAALAHDVLVTLGAVALSLYVAPFLGFLQIDPVKINLAIVAAFMTIIGYSLNDTIVVFDRLREVRGKSPTINGAMINTSMNQVLSRTLLTSLTTLLVVIVLFFGGGQGIHGFAFCMIVGIVAGTYSSIFIASPLVLWLIRQPMASTASGSSASSSAVKAKV